MELEFWKMQGLGNDFIMLDDRSGTLAAYISYSDLSVKLCDRHFGIGGDGIILATPSETHDIRFVIFNCDGTQAQMCGNGMRCFAKYLYEKQILVKEQMQVETLAGTVVPKVSLNAQGKVSSVCVDMGEPVLQAKRIPFICTANTAIQETLETEQGDVEVTCVSMGNPHAVIFVERLDQVNIKKMGRAVERHDRFPEKTNVEFIEGVSDTELRMKVWERGAGITLACGTGACAALVAAHLTGKTGRRATVHLDGGDLDIYWDKASNHIFKTGPAGLTFEGRVTV